MKQISLNVTFIVAVVLLEAVTNPHAESSREQLNALVTQLQGNPGDNALREQIIKLAQGLDPAPAVPEESVRHMARGRAAFKGAQKESDYRAAALEFASATNAAPWYGDAYYNLGLAQDKAGDYAAAITSLKLALLAVPDSSDAKELLYEVEYRQEKVISPDAQDPKALQPGGSEAAPAKTIRGTWQWNDIGFLRTITVIESNGVWQVNFKDHEVTIYSTSDQAIHLFAIVLPHRAVREDYKLALSPDGESLSGQFVVMQTADDGIIQNWTPVTMTRVRE